MAENPTDPMSTQPAKTPEEKFAGIYFHNQDKLRPYGQALVTLVNGRKTDPDRPDLPALPGMTELTPDRRPVAARPDDDFDLGELQDRIEKARLLALYHGHELARSVAALPAPRVRRLGGSSPEVRALLARTERQAGRRTRYGRLGSWIRRIASE